ncbi:MAG TPA: hypothetical protein VIV11_42040 [Kofleriaceae bacterium]
MKRLALVLVVVACDRRPAVTACTDKLSGVWITESDAKWSLLDHGGTLEAFPLFDDAVPEGTPRVIDLERGDKLAGEIRRRYMRGPDACEARAPIRITKCEANALQLVVADPQGPLQFAPCRFPLAASSRVERWRRE